MKLIHRESLLVHITLLSSVLLSGVHSSAINLDALSKRAFDYGTSDIINTFRPSGGQTPKKDSDKNTEGDDNDHSKNLGPCAAIQPLTNGYYDLSDLSSTNKESIVSWSAKGHDYNKNFTLAICSSPLKPNIDVNNNYNGLTRVKINSSEVGGFYTDDNGEKFSIGNFNTTPIFRGKKLTLTYTDGSYCPNNIDRKSTILSFTCDRDILTKAQISFVGALHDCDYFFEVKTVHACATAQKSDDLAVIWIFIFILLAALFVYCSGGFLYKRIVLNRRGWRQLPNYQLGSKVSSALSGGWGSRGSKPDGIRLGSNSESFGFIENQNDLLDSLDVESD